MQSAMKIRKFCVVSGGPGALLQLDRINSGRFRGGGGFTLEPAEEETRSAAVEVESARCWSRDSFSKVAMGG